MNTIVTFIVETICKGNVGLAFLVIVCTLFALFALAVFSCCRILERIVTRRSRSLPPYLRGPF